MAGSVEWIDWIEEEEREWLGSDSVI